MSGKKNKWRWGGVGLENHGARSQEGKSEGDTLSLVVPERPYRPRSPTVEAGAPAHTPRHPNRSRISPLHKVGTFYKAYN